MEQKVLNEILESHAHWLQREGGERANFSGSDLRDANLTRANLTEADLHDANLAGANLSGANLHKAYLIGANLTRANLRQANLTGADLRYADFAEPLGLSVLCAQVNTSFENRRITYIPSLNVVTAGCFQGTFEEFEKRVEEEHKDHPFVLSRYRRVIAFLKREAEEDRTREKKMTTASQDDDQQAQD